MRKAALQREFKEVVVYRDDDMFKLVKICTLESPVIWRTHGRVWQMQSGVKCLGMFTVKAFTNRYGTSPPEPATSEKMELEFVKRPV